MPRLLAGLTIALLCLWVCVRGLRARRTRQLAWLGFGSVGLAVAASVGALATGDADLARLAFALSLLSIGFALAVLVSLAPLPARSVWMRVPLVALSLWTATLAAFVQTTSAPSGVLVWATYALAVLVAAGLVALLLQGRERGIVERGELRVPSVRFDCPRCGTRADWGRGIAACTDCGLFLHLHWPAEGSNKGVTDAARTLRFACPQCRSAHAWPVGTSSCPGCGLEVALHWNVQGASQATSKGKADAAG